MAHRFANGWSDAAAGLTAIAHRRASAIRWGVVFLLSAFWIVGGLYYWLRNGEDPAQAIYLTLSAVGMWDVYFDADLDTPGVQLDPTLQLVRFSALATPAVGLLFAFSGQLGRSLARIFNLNASRHVVIAGESPAALSLAVDCRRCGDSVILIAQKLPSETTLGLRRNGVSVLEGEATHIDTLDAARAHRASHVVAFEAEDTANLQIEAAVRRLVGDGRRKRPVGVHVATRSPMLLKEAREMRSAEMREKRNAAPPIDPKPFSLEEMAARALLQQHSQTLLSLASRLGQSRVHLGCFGFDAAAEAVAERVLTSLWSTHFEAPRLSVLGPDPAGAEAGFRARRREAFVYPQLWSADISFLRFNWDTAAIDPEVLGVVEQERGPLTALVVSTGQDPGNIQLALALRRACNQGAKRPIPIYMRETSHSEFSRQYARGDDTGGRGAYLLAFGAHQEGATRARIVDGELDRGAAIAHEYYIKELADRDTMSIRELQAAMRDWSDVLETYRAANRAMADSAMVKLWDAGWRLAVDKERGDVAPAVADDMMEALARREHDRWVAERLISGWRPAGPGEKRDNDLLVHDKLVPWSALGDGDRRNDFVQVRAAMDIARLAHRQGFIRR